VSKRQGVLDASSHASNDCTSKAPTQAETQAAVRHAHTVALECAFPTDSDTPDATGQRVRALTTQGKVAISPFSAACHFPSPFRRLLLPVSHLAAIGSTPSSNSQDLPLFGSNPQARITQN